jgi:hypothetical protein
MGFTKQSAAERAKNDLAKRLKIGVDAVDEKSISDKEFPDMSLGAPAEGELSAQMIAYGWIIKLAAKGKTYEYRADKYQIRLHDFHGENIVVV